MLTAVDVAVLVSDHMTKHFPEDGYAGGWTVARDRRDGTAVVVWRRADEPVQPQVRGMALYRWLCSLRDAGFTGEARTDMEVFGRPEGQSQDGIARWLHVTAWSAPAAVADLPLAPMPPRPPVVTVSVPVGRRMVCPLSGVPVVELEFTYRPDRTEIVAHYQGDGHDWAQVETEPPSWLAGLAEQHRPTGDAS
jgi:hypothetical protein